MLAWTARESGLLAGAASGRMLTIPSVLLAAVAEALPLPALPSAFPVAPQKPPAQDRRPAWTSGFLQEFATDLGGASLAVTRADLGIESPLPPFSGWRASADLTSEWSWYDFDDFADVAGGLGAPMSHAHSTRLGVTVVRPFDTGWTLVARPVVVTSADQEADFEDSVLFGGFVTVGRQLSDDLTLSVGAYAAQQFEEDAVVFPIAGVTWEVNETTKVTSPGPGLRVTHDFGAGWQGFLQGIYRPRDYRLADDSSVPGGAISDDAFPVTVGAVWIPKLGVQLTAQLGALVGREVEVRDDDGDVVFEEEADTSVFAGLGFRIGL